MCVTWDRMQDVCTELCAPVPLAAVQLDAERRLRLLAEDQAVMTHSAAEAEGRRLEAGAAAEEAVLRMEAQADVAW